MTIDVLDRGTRTDPATTSRNGEPPCLLATRLGPIPADRERQLQFRGGLPGFPEHEGYQLDPVGDEAPDLMLLHAIDDGNIAFFVTPIPQAVPVIRTEDIGEVCATLDIAAGDLLLLSIVTFKRREGPPESATPAPASPETASPRIASPGNGTGATPAPVCDTFLNLRAPLFIDLRTRRGTQVVLHNPTYPLRFHLT